MSPPAPHAPVLVTGGAGYLGRHLIAALLARGRRVRSFDQQSFAPGTFDEAVASGQLERVRGDLTNATEVRRAVAGCDAVFHTASRICSLTLARPELRRAVRSVNVDGTQNVIDACVAEGVERLVYTSSINVVAMPAAGVDERAPRVSSLGADLYTATKAEAEARVLAAEGRRGLHCCALRPGGIYGPGEGHHFPRFIRELAAGKMVVNLGDGKSRADNVYIDDLVEAHLAALDALGEGGKANGRAYFVTDGAPMHYFEFFRPAVEALGHRIPTLRLPARVLVAVAWASEAAHLLGAPPPFTTVLEARKLVLDNWFSNEAARRDLGWAPKVDHAEGMRRSMPYLRTLYEAC